jgi:UDP-N-acetylglucosamine transferase subunit ALG13
MKKIDTPHLTQIWTSGLSPQKGHIVLVDKQKFSTHVDLQCFKVAKKFVLMPNTNIVANGKNPRKSLRENKMVNSSVTSVETQNLEEARIHAS